MLTDPKDCIMYLRSRPLTTASDKSGLPCSILAKAISDYRAQDKHSGTVPEHEALRFYGMNHGMALISSSRAPYEPLPAHELSFANQYYTQSSKAAVRAFYYLVLICTRESRHNKSLTKDSKKICDKFTPPVYNFFANISGGEAQISSAFLSSPPEATIGNYCKAMQWCFYNSKWSGGFGGPAWGAVTDCLVHYVEGSYTAEMMLDTIWTLAHNNGPIFNKGMLYGHYSSDLLRILDIQRSGQIPQAVLHDPDIQYLVPADLKPMMAWLQKYYPESIGDHVDWFTVEALGSVGKYPKEKAKQIELGKVSPAAGEAAKKAAEKQKKLAAEAAEKAAAIAATQYTVQPGLTVTKIIRKKAA